jgi:hypothetical protein
MDDTRSEIFVDYTVLQTLAANSFITYIHYSQEPLAAITSFHLPRLLEVLDDKVKKESWDFVDCCFFGRFFFFILLYLLGKEILHNGKKSCILYVTVKCLFPDRPVQKED